MNYLPIANDQLDHIAGEISTLANANIRLRFANVNSTPLKPLIQDLRKNLWAFSMNGQEFDVSGHDDWQLEIKIRGLLKSKRRLNEWASGRKTILGICEAFPDWKGETLSTSLSHSHEFILAAAISPKVGNSSIGIGVDLEPNQRQLSTRLIHTHLAEGLKYPGFSPLQHWCIKEAVIKAGRFRNVGMRDAETLELSLTSVGYEGLSQVSGRLFRFVGKQVGDWTLAFAWDAAGVL
jgi:hypothetical protein